MTKSGWPDEPSDDCPRMMIRDDPPAVPELDEMLTPATLPDRALRTLPSRALVSSSDLTVDTEYPSVFSERVMPMAVTTTSSIVCESSFNETGIWVRPATSTCCGS